MVRAPHILAISQEICSKSPARTRKKFTEIKNIITNFYCGNENTTIMPGACDKVSIATNVYEQKRLVLCTLKKLYQSFKVRHPRIKVRFFTFATCVLTGCV